jgi:deoxycytidine triphosphate deaminase
MSFLTYYKLSKELGKNIVITSQVTNEPFNPIKQLSESCIDLRIHNHFRKFKDEITVINLEDIATLSSDDDEINKKYFDHFPIPENGYELQPLEIIFTSTLEIIKLSPKYIGLIVARRNFAKLGLMVTCSAPKCPPGLEREFPLQIMNCTNKPILITSYARMVQLLVSPMVGKEKPYEGPETDRGDNINIGKDDLSSEGKSIFTE